MEEDWCLYSITLFTFAVIFFFCYIRHIFTFFERNKIPSGTHPTFPCGNVYDVISKGTPMFMHLWKFYNKFKRKNHRLGGFYIFLRPALLIINPRLVEEILKRQEYFLSSEEKLCDFDVKCSTNLLQKISHSLQKAWSRVVLEFQEENVNFNDVLKQVFKTAEGELFGTELGRNEHFYQKLFLLGYPELKKIFNHRMKYDIKNTDLVEELVRKNFSVQEMNNFVNLIVSDLHKCNNLLLFALYELSVNEDIQEELRGEIKRFLDLNTSSFIYRELAGLKFMDTVVSETLRKYPLQPFFNKVSLKDYSENDVRIIEGTSLFVSTFGIHHDKEYYFNPEQFDPDRFSEENVKFIEATKYLPFGSKSNDCFEACYAKLVMKVGLIELLSRFKFSLNKKSPKMIQFDESSFDTLVFKQNVWLTIKKL